MAKKKKEENAIATLGNADAVETMRRLFKKGLSGMNTYKRFPFIQVQHGVKTPKFEIGDSGEETEFNAVVINFDVFREYYPEGKNVPACTSVGGNYGTNYGACSKCPYFQWGTGNNGNGRACSESRRTLLKVEGREGVFELKFSPSSLKEFDTYKEMVLTELGMPVQMAVTQFTLDTKSIKGRKPWSVVKVENVHPITEMSEEARNEVLALVTKYEEVYPHTKAPEVAADASGTTQDLSSDGEENAGVAGAVSSDDDNVPF